MRTARAALLTGPNTTRIENIPLPEIGVDDALLRVEACGLCGSDIEQITTGGRMPLPVIPGHEPLGIIEQIGPRAAERWGVTTGDRVVVEVVVPCRECRHCRDGLFTYCDRSIGAYGYRPFDAPSTLIGGWSEYMYLHPNSVVHKMDATIPVAIAATYNSLAAGIRWAVQLGGVKQGDTVVVLGAGQRGIAAVIAARAAGADRIFITGLARDSHKLAIAQAFGAEAAILADEEDVPGRVRELTDESLADVVLDITPMAAQPVRDALEIVRGGGTIVLAGLKHGHAIELVTDTLIQKGVTMVGARGVEGSSIEAAIRLIESGEYPLELLTTHTFSLDDAVSAVAVLAGDVPGETAINVAIVP
ncbi:zinc-binding dehydrogenase [Microbacterium sediminicola]|uniref:Zinc-binding dehydrogenase n=1 Tax=Microbacterium sediminicola TaxID=415210 RepID=A0ABP4TZJ8_9MICO